MDRTPKSHASRPRVPPEAPPEAHKLAAQTGIPLAQACQVVQGKITMAELLKQMLHREQVRRLTEQGMSPSLAGQVASGKFTEEHGWRIHRAATHPDYRPERSVFPQLVEAAVPVHIERFGQASGPAATVLRNETYEIELACGDGESEVVLKHDIKWIVAAHQEEALQRCKGRDETVAALGLGAAGHCGQRMRTSRQIRVSYLDSPVPLRFVTRDGDVLVGRARWGSKYELGLQLLTPEGRPGPETTLFYHALFQVERVAAASARGEADKGKGQEKKPGQAAGQQGQQGQQGRPGQTHGHGPGKGKGKKHKRR